MSIRANEKQILKSLSSQKQNRNRQYYLATAFWFGSLLLVLGWFSYDEILYAKEAGIDEEDLFHLVLAFAVLAVAGWGLWHWVSLSREEANHKLSFTNQMLQQLRDEWHPQSKISVDLDLTSSKKPSKLYWSGESSHGNDKFKYLDPWLTIKSSFADGSTIKLKFRTKTKKKNIKIVDTKRQILLIVTPNPKRYKKGYLQNLSRLKSQIENTFTQRYNSTLLCQCSKRHQGFSVKISQNQEEYRPEDVLQTLQMIYGLLAQHMNQVGTKTS